MTPLPAKVTAIGKYGQQFRAVVQISWLRDDIGLWRTETAQRFLERGSARSGLLS